MKGSTAFPNLAAEATVSQPALVAFNSPTQKSSAPSSQWYLVFGSGPDLAQAGNAIAAKAESSAKLYAYDLVKKKFTTHDDHLYLYDLGDDPADGAPGSFVGDPVAVDWDLNYPADAVYFGTIGGNESAPTGKVFKLDFRPSSGTTLEDESTAPVVLTDIKNPVTAAPAVTRDEYNNHWIIGGTPPTRRKEKAISIA